MLESIVSDGEMSKPSYATYVKHRVDGIGMDATAAEKGRQVMLSLASAALKCAMSAQAGRDRRSAAGRGRPERGRALEGDGVAS